MNLGQRRAPGVRTKIAIFGFIGILLVLFGLLVSAAVAVPGSTTSPTPQITYTVNGLTCPLPVGTASKVGLAVQVVVQSNEFLSATKGLPYALYYSGNMTQRSETYGNVTTQLPNALELGFATYGAGTQCDEKGLWSNWIDVQVPVLKGSYAVGGESVHSVGGPK